MKKILIIQGHPDNKQEHFGHTLAKKYVSAAHAATHQTRQINIASLDFPLLTSEDDYRNSQPCQTIRDAQSDILWADHLVIIYPLWLGDMPAIVKAFFEQVFRPEFVSIEGAVGAHCGKALEGKSARVFVTMGMPAVAYRWFFRSHSVKSLKRNILTFCGFKPVQFTLIGNVSEGNEDSLYQSLRNAARLGQLGL